jgi:hypothetical protein
MYEIEMFENFVKIIEPVAIELMSRLILNRHYTRSVYLVKLTLSGVTGFTKIVINKGTDCNTVLLIHLTGRGSRHILSPKMVAVLILE